jgi:uncharacterized membrane protein
MMQVQKMEMSFSGPLPMPNTLERYEQIVPGSAGLIIARAEKQSDHRMELEKRALNSEIKRSQWGLAAGFVLCLLILTYAFILGLEGHDWLAGSMVAIDLIALASIFVYGTISRRKERTERAKFLTGRS